MSNNPVFQALKIGARPSKAVRGWPYDDQGAAMEQSQEMAQQSISDYQKGWNDSALGRTNPDLVNNHAYRMGRADRESYRATR